MSLLSGIFSDIFARQENALTRIDPRTKLLIACIALLAVIISESPVLPLCVLFICFATTLAAGLPLRLVALRLAASMGVATVLLVLQSVMNGTTPWWTIPLFGWKIIVTKEGARAGFLIAARVLGAVSVVLLLSSVTPAHRIFCALRSLGVPQGWVEIALLMYRYIFVVLDIAGDLTAAQKLRLGYSSPRRGMSSLGMVAGTVIIRSMDQAVRTNEAMRTRGCGENIPIGPLQPMPRRDWGFIAAAACIFCGLYFFLELPFAR